MRLARARGITRAMVRVIPDRPPQAVSVRASPPRATPKARDAHPSLAAPKRPTRDHRARHGINYGLRRVDSEASRAVFRRPSCEVFPMTIEAERSEERRVGKEGK